MKNIEKDFKLFARDLGISSLTLDSYKNIQMNNVFKPESIYKPMGMTPSIIEERPMNMAIMSVFDRLMMDRIIYLGYPISEQVANVINAQLLYLTSVDAKKDIQIYINSPGGSVYDGLGIYDTMQYINPNVATINTGLCASMAYVLLCAGEKGKRSALKHSRSMQHQPLGGAQGQASDIEITAQQIQILKKELYEIIAYHTGQDYKKIYEDCDRDHWMTADEALKYGVIDKVLGGKKDSKK